MRRGNRSGRTVVTASFAVLALVALGLGAWQFNHSGISLQALGGSAPFLGKGDGGPVTDEGSTVEAQVPKGLPQQASLGEPFETQGYRVTVESYAVSKATAGVPPLQDVDRIKCYGASLDASGTFTDDHNYVTVRLVIENISQEGDGSLASDGEVLLNSFVLATKDGNAGISLAEPQNSDRADFDRPIPQAAHYELAPGESVTVALSFIMTDEGLRDAEGNLYLSTMFTGMDLMDPKEAGSWWVLLNGKDGE